jgi:hypothetical protein
MKSMRWFYIYNWGLGIFFMSIFFGLTKVIYLLANGIQMINGSFFLESTINSMTGVALFSIPGSLPALLMFIGLTKAFKTPLENKKNYWMMIVLGICSVVYNVIIVFALGYSSSSENGYVLLITGVPSLLAITSALVCTKTLLFNN